MTEPTTGAQNKRLNTPVLFLTFNRLDTTEQVFEAIRRARPPRLYLASDGPRDSRPGEEEKVKNVREYVLGHIDWECEVKTLFREKNLGCKYAVSGAISWFFENEEMGIILEDDVLPVPSFFPYCEELLERYRDDERIAHISGFNPLTSFDANGDSYFFSKFGPIWGWASWRRAWRQYDVEISSWPQFRDYYLRFVTDTPKEESWRRSLFDQLYRKEIDTWDYQWSYARMIGDQLNATPTVNLIKNIGFGHADSTHTHASIDERFLTVYDIKLTTHPRFIVRNKIYDQLYLDRFALQVSFLKRLPGALRRRLKKFRAFLTKPSTPTGGAASS